jgi:Ni/Co efflux regulator RcnB
MLCSEREDTVMLKKAALTLAGIAMLAIPTVASARDRDDYGYGREGGRRDNHEWRERREHERHEWREHERRERRWNNNGYYNNGYYNSPYYGQYYSPYYNSPSYSNGYYDAYGNWHSYGW